MAENNEQVPAETPADEKMIYIGSERVVQYQRSEEANLVAYVLENGYHDDCTLAQFDAMVSDQAYSDTEVNTRKWGPTQIAIIKILMQDNLKLNDKDFVLNMVDTSLTNSVDRAMAKMFGKEIPGQISLAQIHFSLIDTDTDDESQEQAS